MDFLECLRYQETKKSLAYSCYRLYYKQTRAEDFALGEMLGNELTCSLGFAAYLCNRGRWAKGRTGETTWCNNLRCWPVERETTRNRIFNVREDVFLGSHSGEQKSACRLNCWSPLPDADKALFGWTVRCLTLVSYGRWANAMLLNKVLST